jgi:uncharacterized protein (TIGR00730 family)
MESVCVFCGSRPGRGEAYVESARSLGRALAGRGIRLVYGGGKVGLMGVVADAALEAGGEAVGVIPRMLVEREISHGGLTELHVVGSMHERKALMNDLSDGFVALAGGFGTMEELFEVLTWGQLGLHGKPCGFLDANGYYGPLLSFFDRMVDEGFLEGQNRARVVFETDPDALLDAFRFYEPPRTARWVRESET